MIMEETGAARVIVEPVITRIADSPHATPIAIGLIVLIALIEAAAARFL